MALTVNTNVSALNAQRATLDSQKEMASAMERLASGKRINSAVDDAAGIAIAARMESQISGLNQAVRNANDAISLVSTAEGALQETTAILQRIRELSIQSAGGAPSNSDRVNLNKEVVQLQEELSRIANTTRFNGGLLLNGTFVDTDFQIGQSNNEEITVSIGDIRPERIGAFTQRTVEHVGLVSSGASLDAIDNGVNQQTLVVQVGNEVPRTISINKGDDARTISDKINHAGAQVNSTAVTTSNAYIDGYGSFSFKISSSSAPDIEDVITVGATAGSQAASLAAEINRGYSEHNISATIEVDSDGVEYVKMVQDDGYDIKIQDYVTTGNSSLDFDEDGVDELTGGYGRTATIVGGAITIDAPASFLVSSDDVSNTILQGTRASLEVVGVSSDPALYQDKSFDITVSGVTKTVNLAAPPPAVPTDATSPVMAVEFTATQQLQGPSSQQLGALRQNSYTVTTIDTATTPARGSADVQFSLSVNGGSAQDLDMAAALSALGYESGEEVSAADFAAAMQTTISNNPYFNSGDEAVTVTLTDYGQIKLDVAGGSGAITFAESSKYSAAYAVSWTGSSDVTAVSDQITMLDHGYTTGDSVTYSTSGATDTGLTAGTYFVIAADSNTIQLASTLANANAGTAVALTGDGTGEQISRAAGDGVAAAMIVNTAPTDGSTTESAADGSLTLGETLNDVTTNPNSPYGPVNPLGITDRVIATGANDTFTLAVNDGAPTVIEVVAGTYYAMEELATAVQTAIDSSPFSSTGSFPITVEATTDENGDWGLSFGSVDGHSIQVGGTSFLTDVLALSVADPSSAADIDIANSWTSATDVNAGTNRITISGHGYSTGDAVLYNATSADTGLVSGTTYYVAVVDADTISLSTTEANALGGTIIVLTGDGAGEQISDGAGERKVAISAGPIDEAATRLAINVNGGGFYDLDLKTHLTAAGVEATATSVTEDQFVTALQAALDDSVYFTGDEAVTVSVTSAGLVQLDVAGGAGTVVVAEHSAYRAGVTGAVATNGLGATLTGTVSNAVALSNGFSTGEASQSGTGGSIILGSTANTANGDPQDGDYVKTFGISAVEVTAATGDELYISIDDGTATLLTIPAGDYLNMADLAAAIQTQIDGSPEIGLAGTVSVTATSTQNSTDESWGLSFASSNGSKMDLFGNFFGSSLGISTGSDGSTQLGRSTDTWVMGDDIDATTDRVTLNNHGLSTGDALVYTQGTTADTGLPLVNAATYYAIVIDTDTIQLATTVALANAGTEITLDGLGTDDQSLTFTGDPITIEEVGEAPVGAAGYRTSVEAGAFSEGIDLSSDNQVTIEVLDDETGALSTKTITLGSSAGSVSFSDYMDLVASAANSEFVDEGFTFSAAGSDRSFTMTFEPTGGRTVTLSGASITQAFGASVSASGEPSNMDGLAFESMDDVLAELNAQFETLDIPITATYSRGGDTFNFLVTTGPADASSTISLSGDDLVELGFTGVLESIGGGVDRAEEVRYVSQIDISTRDSASLAMTVVDAALETLAGVRGGLGAVANRLESTISNLMNISENTSAAMSRVMDADFAAESSRLARAQILQEASVAMLAQANSSAQSVLKLLQ